MPVSRTKKTTGGWDGSDEWTILVASKDDSIQKLVTDTLRDHENKIIAVSSVKEFLEQLADGSVDFIIYDLDLPPLNTIDAFTIKQVYHPRIPSILIYDNDNYAVTKSIIDKGVIFRMLKPINTHDLRKIFDGIRQRKNQIPT